MSEGLNVSTGGELSGGPPGLAIPTATGRRLELVVALGIIILDQMTKAVVHAQLPLHSSVNVIPNLMDLTHVQNTGAAFGFLNTAEIPFKAVLITLIAAGALLAIGIYATRLAADDRMARVGLSLILGGAVGNLIDRAVNGYVVDFVDVYWRDVHFWAFNVADAAITVGAAIMILDMLGIGRHVSPTV